MANITTKFVSSFSELYFRPSVLSAGEIAAPRDWFTATGTNGSARVETVTVVLSGGTATAGTLTLSVTAKGRTSDLDIEVQGDEDADELAALIQTSLGYHPDINADVVGAITTGSFDVTFEELAGDASITTKTALGSDSVTITEAAAYLQATDSTVLIPVVSEMGTLANESNVIEVAAFGDEFKSKLAGQSDAGTLDVSLFWAPRDPVHLALREAAVSKVPMSMGIKWKSDANGTDTEYVIFNGFVSSFSLDQGFDDVVKASCTIAIDGATKFAAAQ